MMGRDRRVDWALLLQRFPQGKRGNRPDLTQAGDPLGGARFCVKYPGRLTPQAPPAIREQADEAGSEEELLVPGRR